LRAAAGQVHCSRCNSIFNATQHLHAPDTEKADDGISLAGLFDDPQPTGLSASEDDASLFDMPSDPAALAEIDQLLDALPSIPADTQSTAENRHQQPDKTPPLADAGQQPPAITNQERATSGYPPGPADTPTNHQENPTHSTPLSRSDRDPPPLQPEQILGTPPPPAKPRHTLLWSVVSLLLLLAALAQAAWWGQERLLADPQARSLLERVCQIAHCQLPELRAPDKFMVIERSVISHPSTPDALQLRLQFANQAGFPQPYPELLLILYNSRQQTVARRLFRPDEYLDNIITGRPLIAAGQQITVKMSLADPGADVTGFKFEFF